MTVPVVLPGGDVVIPASACPELAGALRLYSDECRGVRRPVAAPRPRMSAVLGAVAEAVNAASVAYAVRPRFADVTWVDVPQAAEMLSTSPAMVQRWLRERKLAGEKVGRVWRADLASVKEFADGRPTAAAGVRGGGRGKRLG